MESLICKNNVINSIMSILIDSLGFTNAGRLVIPTYGRNPKGRVREGVSPPAIENFCNIESKKMHSIAV